MSSLWLDLRYALRLMTKTPALTVVLAVTLALGIGASTTIFSVVSSVVLKPLPYANPERLVRVYSEFNSSQMNLKRFWISPPEYYDLKEACTSCESVAAWSYGTASLAGGDRPVRIQAAYATHTLLPLLGVKPQLGRWFDASEDVKGDATVVVLGHDVWMRAFAGDPGIIGKKVHMDALPVTVIGVMPPGFDFLDRQEAWVPLCFDWTKGNRGNHFLNVVARVKPDSSLEAFQDELVSLSIHWGHNRTPRNHTMSPYAPPLPSHPMIALAFHDDLVGGLATTLWLLQAAVLLVLLIAIVNVANLLLARSETRTREVAVRAALGASRGRLIRQFITESMLLGILGGGLGILVAVWAVDGVTALIPKSAPRASEIALDTSAVVFAVVCSIGAALLFGLAPILHARKTDLHAALKDGSPRTTGNKTRLRVRRGLVIAEIALAVLLVIGCTVMVRAFSKLQQVELGYNPDQLLTFELELPKKTYPGATGDVFWHRVQDRLRALPGVTSVTLIDGLPPQRPINANDINFPGKVLPPDVAANVDYWQVVGDDFVETMGMRIVKGRGLLPTDTLEAPPVLLVNEAFVNKFFPGEDPIGKKVEIDEQKPPNKPIHQTIVGVVADMKQAGIDRPSGTEVYVPTWQYTGLSNPPDAQVSSFIAIRTQGDPEELMPAATRVVADLDPSLPISKMRSMNDVQWEAVARPRFLTFLLASFAGLALLLAAVGIYGVMSHTVAQRTHEIGLRVALGAQPSQVRAMVMRQAAVLVLVGVVVGAVGAFWLQFALGSALETVFYGDSLNQPLLSAGVAAVVTAVAIFATWIPARRATRVEPTVALRSE
ncbi:MAG: ABC transporter permease [Kofleriaceae bacterium]